MPRSSFSEPIGGGFLFGMGGGLLGLGVWAMFAFGSLFFGLFAIMGLVVVSLSVEMISGDPKYLELGIRVGALGGWLWVTLAIADTLNQTDPLLLPNPYITALFGLASGAFMLSAFQSAGWIDGPLLWEGPADE